jgi:uncharacterized protein YkwD
MGCHDSRHQRPETETVTGGPPRTPRRPASVPPGVPARHRAAARRTRYLLAGLLILPLLAALGLYLSVHRGPGPAPASATAQVTTQPAPSSACDPAAPVGSCAGSPFHAAVATVPASASPPIARTKHPHARPSSSASGPASPRPAPATTAPATGRPGSSPAGPVAQVLALINQARSAAGLAPLTVTSGLNISASRHNATMAGGCGLSHQCPGEPDLGARETAAGVAWTACGENIGEGGRVADSSADIARMAVGLTQAMLNEKPPDDGHRRNILSRSFTHVGIAIYRDASGTVWLTQDFSN